MPAFSFSAPGKSILFGEHAVVYGFPAIAVPLSSISLKVTIQPLPVDNKIIIDNRDLHEELNLDTITKDNPYKHSIETIRDYLKIDHLPSMRIIISSKIPIGSGLGSSAAYSVAISTAITAFLGFKLNLEKINELAYEIEKFQHGNPSGIDNTVVTFKRPIYFRKNYAPEQIKIIEPMELIVADTGIKALTKDVVTQVKTKIEREPDQFTEIFQKIAGVTNIARQDIEMNNQHEVGKLMLENHYLLQQLGVSIPELDKLVDIAVKEGAYGAKLCGSGKGGNIVALIPPEKAEKIKSSLLNAGAVFCLSSTIEKRKKIN